VDYGDCVITFCGGVFWSGLCEYVREAFPDFFGCFVWIFWFQYWFPACDVDLFNEVQNI